LAAYRGWQHQVWPKVCEQGGVDVLGDVVGCIFAQGDLVDPGPLQAVGQVELAAGLRPVQGAGPTSPAAARARPAAARGDLSRRPRGLGRQRLPGEAQCPARFRRHARFARPSTASGSSPWWHGRQASAGTRQICVPAQIETGPSAAWPAPPSSGTASRRSITAQPGRGQGRVEPDDTGALCGRSAICRGVLIVLNRARVSRAALS
jgi:hypothetical protein